MTRTASHFLQCSRHQSYLYTAKSRLQSQNRYTCVPGSLWMYLGVSLAFGLNWPKLSKREEAGRSVDPLWIPKFLEFDMMEITKEKVKRPILMRTDSLAKKEIVFSATEKSQPPFSLDSQAPCTCASQTFLCSSHYLSILFGNLEKKTSLVAQTVKCLSTNKSSNK